MYIMLSNRLTERSKRSFVRFWQLLSLAWVCSALLAVMAPPVLAAETNPGSLLEKHAAMRSQLASNVFNRPLVLDSVQTGNRVTGNAYAVLDVPFSLVNSNLKTPGQMCELVILHINTKYCRPAGASNPNLMMVNFGKKTAQQLDDTFALQFVMTANPPNPNFMRVQLNADKGPLGTSNYAISLAAVPLPNNKTFLHLQYAYGFGLAGRIAMQAYLSTAGSSKVGFTKIETNSNESNANAGANGGADGGANGGVYVGGMRGAVERNTMRYYLAIDAYLKSLSVPAHEQLDNRLEKWFDSTEQYPLQLHEADKASYLNMKKDEIERQKKGVPHI